eukprot:scaffold135674_cov17-Tisochrysis_lutea.AAC.1
MELANTCCDAPVIQDISKAAERAGKSTNHALSKLAMGCRQEADVVASVQALSPLALALLPINSVTSVIRLRSFEHFRGIGTCQNVFSFTVYMLSPEAMAQ